MARVGPSPFRRFLLALLPAKRFDLTAFLARPEVDAEVREFAAFVTTQGDNMPFEKDPNPNVEEVARVLGDAAHGRHAYRFRDGGRNQRRLARSIFEALRDEAKLPVIHERYQPAFDAAVERAAQLLDAFTKAEG